MKPILFILSIAMHLVLHGQITISDSFEHDGITRTYSYYVPASYTPENPVPLMIGLHGTSSSGEEFEQYRDFRPIADTANFIVVYPNGTKIVGISFWNYGNVMGSTVDDVGFIEALIDTLSAHYSIDQSRVYATGMSNGSFMSYALACQSNRFAAIGAVTGSMSTGMYNNCSPAQAIPVLHIHGTADGINPYEGNSTMKSIEDVIAFWTNENQCNSVPIVTEIIDIDVNDNATVTHYLYENGIDGNTVELFKVENGGHSWPGSPMPNSGEVTCMDFDACKEIWRFFSQYAHPTLGINEQSDDFQFVVYPNPATDELNIKLESSKRISKVQLVNSKGEIIYDEKGENIQNLKVYHLHSGTYFITIYSDSGTATKKILIL